MVNYDDLRGKLRLNMYEPQREFKSPFERDLYENKMRRLEKQRRQAADY